MHKDSFEYYSQVHPTQWDQQEHEGRVWQPEQIVALVCALIPICIIISNAVRHIVGG